MRTTLHNGPQSSAEIKIGFESHLWEKNHIFIHFFAPPWEPTQNWQCIMVSSSQYLSHRKRSQTMLCQSHMIFINIFWWFKNIVWTSGPTSVSVPSSGYLEFKLHDSNFSREKKVIIATEITSQTQTETCESTNGSHYIFQDILHLSLVKLKNTWLMLRFPFPQWPMKNS